MSATSAPIDEKKQSKQVDYRNDMNKANTENSDPPSVPIRPPGKRNNNKVKKTNLATGCISAES